MNQVNYDLDAVETALEDEMEYEDRPGPEPMTDSNGLTWQWDETSQQWV